MRTTLTRLEVLIYLCVVVGGIGLAGGITEPPTPTSATQVKAS